MLWFPEEVGGSSGKLKHNEKVQGKACYHYASSSTRRVSGVQWEAEPPPCPAVSETKQSGAYWGKSGQSALYFQPTSGVTGVLGSPKPPYPSGGNETESESVK